MIKKIFILLFFILLSSCSNKKQVFICGDHECINKKEMKAYFKENLYIEVATIEKKSKKKETFDLVKLNISTQKNENNIKITSKDIRKLNKSEKKQKIKEMKIIEKKKKKEEKSKKKLVQLNKNKIQSIKKTKITNREIIKVSDYCEDISNCDIDEIGDLILQNNKTKKYPDINKR